MIRKLLMVAAAAAVSMSGLVAAGVAGSGPAGAKTPPPALSPTTCVMSGTVTFAPPGLSLLGVTTTNKTSTTTSTLSFPSCSVGSLSSTAGTLVIVTKNSKCAQPFTGPGGLNGVTQPTTCAKKLDFYDGASGLGSAGTFKSLGKAVKKLPLTLSEPAGTVTLKSKAGVSSEVTPTSLGGSGQCGSEAGFLIPTTVKTTPKSTGITTGTILVCLGTDNLGGNFITDLTANGDTIASVAIDPATSSITLS